MSARDAARRVDRGAFRALWVGQSISQLGSQVSLLAIPLLAVVTLDATPLEMGLLAALETAPFLLFSLPAGVLADARDRRRLLVLTDLGRAAALLVIPAAFVVGAASLPLLGVVAFVVGALSVTFEVAAQSYVPELLPEERLIEGNQRLELSTSAATVLGPGLAGVLVATIGGAFAIVLDALSYLASAAALLLTPPAPRRSDVARGTQAVARPRRVGHGLTQGFAVVLRDPFLRDLASSTATFNLASAMIAAVFVLYATAVLGIDPGTFGVLYGLANVGFLLGAAVVGYAARRWGVGRTLFSAAALGAVATVLLPLAAGPLAIAFLFLGRFAGALAVPLYNVNARTVCQRRVPGELLGRVNASFRFLDWGPLPVGALLGGMLATVLGIREALFVAACLGVASLAVLSRSPLRRLGPDAVPAAPAAAPVTSGDPVRLA